eukprot:GFYU01001843.1.p1 GENE.GFYU01001843.1~~GFYU01001843.1.p1  ORF type:complete len:2326 (-),score=550.88 GFYU01001843.1:81-6365(-)
MAGQYLSPAMRISVSADKACTAASNSALLASITSVAVNQERTEGTLSVTTPATQQDVYLCYSENPDDTTWETAYQVSANPPVISSVLPHAVPSTLESMVLTVGGVFMTPNIAVVIPPLGTQCGGTFVAGAIAMLVTVTNTDLTAGTVIVPSALPVGEYAVCAGYTPGGVMVDLDIELNSAVPVATSHSIQSLASWTVTKATLVGKSLTLESQVAVSRQTDTLTGCDNVTQGSTMSEGAMFSDSRTSNVGFESPGTYAVCFKPTPTSEWIEVLPKVDSALPTLTSVASPTNPLAGATAATVSLIGTNLLPTVSVRLVLVGDECDSGVGSVSVSSVSTDGTKADLNQVVVPAVPGTYKLCVFVLTTSRDAEWVETTAKLSVRDVCKAGHVAPDDMSPCGGCGVGTFNGVAGGPCEQCPVGHYNNQVGQHTCTPCPAGQYTAALGSTECTVCPVGTFTAGTGSAAVERCLDCPESRWNSLDQRCLCDGPSVSQCVKAETQLDLTLESTVETFNAGEFEKEMETELNASNPNGEKFQVKVLDVLSGSIVVKTRVTGAAATTVESAVTTFVTMASNGTLTTSLGNQVLSVAAEPVVEVAGVPPAGAFWNYDNVGITIAFRDPVSGFVQDGAPDPVATSGTPLILDCAKFFVEPTLSEFGENVQCIARSTIQLDVLIPRSVPFTRVILNTNPTESAWKIIGSELPIAPPADPSALHVILEAPQVVTTQCDFDLDASLSTGFGARAGLMKWVVTDTDTGNVATSFQETVDSDEGLVRAVKTDNLVANKSYRVVLTVTNYLGATKSANVTVTRQLVEDIVPIIELSLASAELTVLASESFSVTASIVPYDCVTNLDQEPHVYLWALLESPSGETAGFASGKATQTFPANSLVPNSEYVFGVRAARLDDLSLQSAQLEFTVNVVSSPLVAEVEGGRIRTLPRSRSISLSAANSYDPDLQGPLSYQWKCNTTSASVESLTQHLGQTTGLDQTTTTFTQLLTETGPCPASVPLDTMTSANVTLIGTDFDVGNYSLGVTVSQGGRTAEVRLLLVVLPGAAPLSAIITPIHAEAKSGALNSGSQFAFRGIASSSTQANINMRWLLDGTPVDGTKNTVVVSDAVENDPSVQQNADYIGAVLSQRIVLTTNEELAQGSHTLALQASDENGASTAAFVFAVNEPPREGVFIVPGTAVTELEPVTVRLASWRDDAADLPLSYYISRVEKDEDGKEVVMTLTDRSLSGTTVLKLGRGLGVGYNVTLRGHVADKWGAEVTVDQTLTVKPLTGTDEEKSVIVQNVIKNLEEDDNKDVSETLSEAIAVAEVVKALEKSANDTATREEAEKQREQLVSVVLQRSNHSDSAIQISQLASATESVTDSATGVLSDKTRKDAAKILQSIADDSQNVGLLDDTDKTIVKALSNIATTSNSTYLEGLENVTLSTLRSLSSTQLKGEPCAGNPIVVSSPKIITGTKRGKPGQIQLSGEDSVPVGMIFPSDFLSDKGSCFDTQVIAFNYNPYGWSALSQAIENDVVSANVRNLGATGEEKVSELPEPIQITLKHSQEPDDISVDACRYWDVQAAYWSSAGCKLGTVTATTATCLCDHLTEFSLSINTINPITDATNIIHVGSNPAPLILVVANFLMFFVTLIYAYWKEKHVRRKHHLQAQMRHTDGRKFDHAYHGSMTSVDEETGRPSVYARQSSAETNPQAATTPAGATGSLTFSLPDAEPVATTDEIPGTFQESWWKSMLHRFRHNHTIGRIFLYSQPDDRFPLVQRVVCFYSITTGSMLVNSLFYGLRNQSALHWFIYAMLSTLATFPFNIALTQLFMRSRRKGEKAKNQSGRGCIQRAVEMSFPHWVNHVGFVIAGVLIVCATYYTLVFGLTKFRDDTSEANQWMLSVFFSIILHLALQEPLKIVTLSAVSSAVVTMRRYDSTGQLPSLSSLMNIFKGKDLDSDDDEGDDGVLSPPGRRKSDAPDIDIDMDIDIHLDDQDEEITMAESAGSPAKLLRRNSSEQVLKDNLGIGHGDATAITAVADTSAVNDRRLSAVDAPGVKSAMGQARSPSRGSKTLEVAEAAAVRFSPLANRRTDGEDDDDDEIDHVAAEKKNCIVM